MDLDSVPSRGQEEEADDFTQKGGGAVSALVSTKGGGSAKGEGGRLL